MVNMKNLNRRQLFINFWATQMKVYDCDTPLYASKYLFSRMEFNEEQKFWFSWIYANTYQLATTFVIWNEFPDFENVDFDRLDEWEDENYKKLSYQVDQKWMKGNLAKIFKSYKEVITKNHKNQIEFFYQFNSSDPLDNFNRLWSVIIKDFYKFGRYTAWFYMQTLKELCNLNLEPSNLKLNFDASHSHRGGLCMALGLDEWNDKKRKFTKDELKLLDSNAKLILEEIKSIHGEKINNQDIDYFMMETALCAFKKLFRYSRGRYIGFYLDRFSEDITKTSSFGWDGINWKMLWESRDEILLPELNNKTINKDKMKIFLDENGSLFSDKHPSMKILNNI